jgi:hypothetical protein
MATTPLVPISHPGSLRMFLTILIIMMFILFILDTSWALDTFEIK